VFKRGVTCRTGTTARKRVLMGGRAFQGKEKKEWNGKGKRFHTTKSRLGGETGWTVVGNSP